MMVLNNMGELGALLRKLREKESLRDVSSRSGVSHSYLGLIEKGVDQRSGKPIKPTPETLKALADAYNYSYEELMRKAGYIQETSEIYKLTDAISNEPSQIFDLEKALQEGMLFFRGRVLSKKECKKILDMIHIMSRD